MKKSYYILYVSALFLFNCNSTKKEEKKTMDTNEIIERPLENVLKQKKAKFEEKAAEQKKKIYTDGIQSVINNKIVESALKIGDTAPNFTLKNASNKNISLYEKLNDGPVILMWYRGGWCPYCNLTLQHMQQQLPDFKKHQANLLALTPELPDNSMSTKEKNKLDFEVLSDIDNAIAKQYKVVFKLTKEVAESYEKGFGLSTFNGNTKGELPLAATYVIGKDKIIKYAFLDADYRNRAEPKDILKVLKDLK